GGGCAASTAGDYLRFAQMLLEGGKLDGKRLLSRKTVEYMLSNQLAPNTVNLIANADPTSADMGFGLGLAAGAPPRLSREGGPGGEGWEGWAGSGSFGGRARTARGGGPIRGKAPRWCSGPSPPARSAGTTAR